MMLPTVLPPRLSSLFNGTFSEHYVWFEVLKVELLSVEANGSTSVLCWAIIRLRIAWNHIKGREGDLFSDCQP